MRRSDRERGREFAIDVITRCDYGTLATVNPDGAPYCIPISPAILNGNIYFHCAPEGHKLDNINRNNSICLSCAADVRVVPEKLTVSYSSAVVFGKCYAADDRDERFEALQAITEKYAPGADFGKTVKPDFDVPAIYRISIDQITGKYHE